MYTFEFTDRYLSSNETEIFDDYLNHYGLDKNIWEVFSCLFKSGLKNTKPYLLKAFKDNRDVIFLLQQVFHCSESLQSIAKTHEDTRL